VTPSYPADRPSADRAPAERVALPADRIALVDLLDRVLAGGVVIAGDITLSVADVDMVTISLRALVTSVSALADRLPPPASTHWMPDDS
jgi:Gas vesicle protein